MPCQISLSKAFLDDFEQSTDTAIENLTKMTVVEMKKLAPYARPSQYPGGYYNTITGWTNGGSLSLSIHAEGKGKKTTIESYMPYAIFRNYNNELNPQTKKYIERSIANVLKGKQQQWWVANA